MKRKKSIEIQTTDIQGTMYSGKYWNLKQQVVKTTQSIYGSDCNRK